MPSYPHHHHDHEPSALLHEQLAHTDDFQTAASIFAQLGDPTRVRLFWLLCHCEECVINLAAMMEMSSPALSHHLRILRDTNLIVSRREGKEVFYRTSDSEAARFLHQMIEQILSITCPESSAQEVSDSPSSYREQQTEIIHQVHDYLLTHLNERITIDTLSRHFLINPTTLKSLFKSTYGKSVAAHIKEHRLEAAADLLKNTDLTIAQIAEKVGYDSQSKFSAAFKEHYQLLPRDYRRNEAIPQSIKE